VFRCNCLVWALWQWLTKGGYCGWRWSHYGPVWHFVWSPDLKTWWGFVPVKPKHGWWVLFVMWWFLGTVVEERPKTAT
jgi:hypothetical protein